MNDIDYLKLAIKQARESVEKGGFPAGAVLVRDGRIIAEGVSLGFLLHDPTSHAETATIREACKKLETVNLSGATLYASLEPCLMCFSVSNWAKVSKIVYGCNKTDEMVSKEYYEGHNTTQKINESNTHKIELEYMSDYEAEMLEPIKQWESKFL